MAGMEETLQFQITKVWAKNFRSIANASVDLGQLTVLVGRNISGKSNVMDVLRFLKDAMRDDLELAVTDRQGIGAVRRWQPRGRRHDIEIGVIAEGNVNRSNDYRVTYELVIASNKDGAYRIKREQAEVLFLQANSSGDDSKMAWFVNTNGTLRSCGLQPLNLQNGKTASTEANLVLPILGRLSWSRKNSRDSQQIRMASRTLTDLYRSLREMQFYQLYPNAMRMPQKVGQPYPLDALGENLATVLRNLLREDAAGVARIRAILPHLIPGVLDVRVRSAGGYLVVQLQHEANSQQNGHCPWFDLSQESDGTLRLLGLLVALYQRPAPLLIGIEDPDLAIHPGLLGVLADVLREGALNFQLLVTTHCPDLIDQLSTEDLRVVELVGGNTAVGPVTRSQEQAVKEHLFSPGELHRMEGLRLDGQDA